MKVKFLRDYRGRETGEKFAREGEEWEIDPREIEHLVNEEVIERPKALPAVASPNDPPQSPRPGDRAEGRKTVGEGEEEGLPLLNLTPKKPSSGKAKK